MEKNKILNILSFIGILVLIAAIYRLVRNIRETTSTELYSKEGLRELQDDNGYARIEELRKESIVKSHEYSSEVLS